MDFVSVHRQQLNAYRDVQVIRLTANPSITMATIHGDYISGVLERTGMWEPDLTHMLVDIASTSGGIMVDVGANMGYFSMLWAKAKAGNKVYAFEPSTRILDILTHNISMNGLGAYIDVLPIAAGSSSDILRFWTGPEHETGHGGFSSDSDENTVPVVVVKLDDFFESIDVLKIDTEGADALVLEGCERLLREQKIKQIFFEVNKPRCLKLGVLPSLALDILQKNRYEICLMRDCGPDMSEYSACPVA